jgi:hypothetical protein
MDYEEFIKNFDKYLKLNELAITPDELKNIVRLNDAGNFSELLKKYNELISELQKEIKKLKLKDINYAETTQSNIITIETTYNNPVSIFLNNLKQFLSRINDRRFQQKIKNENIKFNHSLVIDIETTHYNKIDIINELPPFMQNLGLGKKIYKKLIEDFNYISSTGDNYSIESSMVWKSISTDNDIYFFSNGKNIIIFSKKYKKEKIITQLKKFFKLLNKEHYLDSEFLKNYNLTKNHITL